MSLLNSFAADVAVALCCVYISSPQSDNFVVAVFILIHIFHPQQSVLSAFSLSGAYHHGVVMENGWRTEHIYETRKRAEKVK